MAVFSGVFQKLQMANCKGPQEMKVDFGRSWMKQGLLTMTLGSNPVGYFYIDGGRGAIVHWVGLRLAM